MHFVIEFYILFKGLLERISKFNISAILLFINAFDRAKMMRNAYFLAKLKKTFIGYQFW